MPKHPDFVKIHSRFSSQFGEKEGTQKFHAFVNKKGLDDTKPLPRKNKEKKEFKEKFCSVLGCEVKEDDLTYHVEGLIATSHIDNVDLEDGVDIPDMIPKATLESMANQGNSDFNSRVMGVHHSEGQMYNPQYYGEADVKNTPMAVVELPDGEWGLYVDTKLLKSDPKTPEIIQRFESGDLNSFSITYDTDGFNTTDFEFVGDRLVRTLLPDTRLRGYTGASNPKNPNAVATAFGFKEFKEFEDKAKVNCDKEVEKMSDNKDDVKKPNDPAQDPAPTEGQPAAPAAGNDVQPSGDAAPAADKGGDSVDDTEEKEFKEFKEFQAMKAKNLKNLEAKEALDANSNAIAQAVVGAMEKKEAVLKDGASPGKAKEASLEMKEFLEMVESPGKIEVKESFRRAGAICEFKGIDFATAVTSMVQRREYKSFGTNGRMLEFKSLGITTNQNTDTDYLQSSAELQDVYDPVIYNALNQATVTWNLLAKDDESKKGNNQVQFTLKIAANTSAGFYTGNAVSSGNVSRLKYQTKFKKCQVGVCVDGDMIAAARGGPVSDVFAQEVMDSTMDMLSVINIALFAEVGLETAAGVIGFEYIADSAGNTSLYNLTRSAANKLAPDSAADTYIDGSSAVVTMSNLRKMKRQAVREGANKRNLIYITSDIQADLLRGKFDDSRRMLKATDTDFGFSTDLFVDGIPVFEDKDCNDDDWFCIDTETHRIGIWIPPTVEKLGKNADAESAFVKTYFATYNRGPRRLSMIHSNATS